ncbi:hypothetical protein BBJ28_00024286, partial [Nothophytophthora sp. Chile5]
MAGRDSRDSGNIRVSERHPVFSGLPSSSPSGRRHHPQRPLVPPPPPPPPPQLQQYDPREMDYGMSETEHQLPGVDMPYVRTESAPRGGGFTNAMLEGGCVIFRRFPCSLEDIRHESSEDSFDNGSYVTDKIRGGPNEDIGWFHAKIKVESSIHWANNYKIQVFMFLVFIGGAAVTIIFADNTANASVGLVSGSVITLLCCSSVVYTFLTRPSWRKHPNPIIFFRSLCDISLVSVLLVTELYKCGKGECKEALTGASCTATAALTQFFLWSSESWFFVMAIDMLSSLQSPFTDYKTNVRRYHVFVWATVFDVSQLLLHLSPQVNLALRCEVLYYTTTGIIQAVRDTQHLPPGANQQELYLQPQGTEDNRGSLGVDEYMIRTRPKAALGKGTLFIDYCPHTFQTIREHFGIDTNQYIESLSRTTKERLSEGASGAFMFFSHDQQLIVKSMSDEESVFLRSVAAEYASFLLTNPDSLLTRFYGCHAIRLYGNTFNFVVMANLFSTEKVIHRRYDIKGSWVNRSAKHPSKGKRVTCRHCNAKYVFGSTDAENCRARVGRHEPNVILKDNDLTAKVRLDPKVAEDLYDQLVKDANFLSRLGIMDYSLLLGIHNVEYMVNPDMEEETLPPKELAGPRRRTINNSVMANRGGREGSNAPPMGNSAPRSKPRAGLPRLATGTRRANTVVGPSIYYFGLIDILQTWNMDKKLERFAKTKMLAK